MNTQRIYGVLDRLVYHGTAGTDMINSVAALRRLFTDAKGVVAVPSEVMRKRNSKASPDKTPDPVLQTIIAGLRERLAVVECEKATSEREKSCQIEALLEEITTLQSQLDAS
jgi:hypothetical protein